MHSKRPTEVQPRAHSPLRKLHQRAVTYCEHLYITLLAAMKIAPTCRDILRVCLSRNSRNTGHSSSTSALLQTPLRTLHQRAATYCEHLSIILLAAMKVAPTCRDILRVCLSRNSRTHARASINVSHVLRIDVVAQEVTDLLVQAIPPREASRLHAIIHHVFKQRFGWNLVS